MTNLRYDLDEIAKKAHALSKRDNRGRDIFPLLIDAIRNEGAMTPEVLARFYRYFLPSAVPAKTKTAEKWVALAAADEHEQRDYLQFVYSDGERIMGTDGHRLHLYTTTKYSPGYYNTKMAKIHGPEWHKYPNVDRVIPVEAACMRVAAIEDFEPVHVGVDVPLPSLSLNGGVNVNSNYLRAAASFMKEPVVKYSDHMSPVLLIDNSNSNTKAVVMPQRIL